MCFNQKGDISTLDGTSLKLVDKFPYLGSSVSSTEKDIDTRLTKAWTAIDRLSIIWKSNLNRSWQKHPTRRQLYGHLSPITKTIQARQTRHAGHFWGSKDKTVSDVLLWTPTYGQSKPGLPARTFIQHVVSEFQPKSCQYFLFQTNSH